MESQIQPAPVVVVAPPRPVPAPAPRRTAPRAFFLLLCALTTSGLLWLSYFPVNWGWLAWFALVPLLGLVRTPARPWFVYLCAWAGGLAFYAPALQWMRVADPRMYFTWIFLTLYCALYFPFALWIIRFLDRRTGLPLLLTLPVVWTALEYFRSWFGTGFSWYLLGHTQHDFLYVIQIADLAGAFGVSFLVAAVNAVLFEALYRWDGFRLRCAGPDAPAPRKRTVLLLQAGIIAAALLATAGYGAWRLWPETFAPGPRIALVQGNVPQQIRNDMNQPGMMLAHFGALCDLAARQTPKPDLIVLPETSFPGADWCENAAGAPPTAPDGWELRTKECRPRMHTIAQWWGTNVLFGLDSSVFEGDGHTHHYNSALLIDRDGQPLGRYDKIHCVPFGEYVPLRDVLPWMQTFAPYDNYDYSVSPGRAESRLPLTGDNGRTVSFGVVICYEDTDPDRARPYAGGDGGPPVDFLLNISNDGWFDGTSEHDEHLAICRFRAIECRRSIGRAVNMGVSAVIDGNGRVLAPEHVRGTEWNKVRGTFPERFKLAADEIKLAGDLFPDDDRAAVWQIVDGRGGPRDLPTAEWADYKKVPGILLADIPIDHRVSLYARWGDWLPCGCWAFLVVGVVLAFVRGRRSVRPAG